PRFGSRHFDKIAHVQALREKRRKAHFRVGSLTSKQQAIRIDVAARRHRFDSRVEGANIGRQRSAAGAAGATNLRRVDIEAAEQIVDRAFGVPNEEASHALANENALSSSL